jgi:hypothetical protein
METKRSNVRRVYIYKRREKERKREGKAKTDHRQRQSLIETHTHTHTQVQQNKKGTPSGEEETNQFSSNQSIWRTDLNPVRRDEKKKVPFAPPQ